MIYLISTEIIRLTGVVGPGQVAIGTDLDGNYRPVLPATISSPVRRLLRDRGLKAVHVRQVLGGNAADLLNRFGPCTPGMPRSPRTHWPAMSGLRGGPKAVPAGGRAN
jgi:hypothetical protein